MKSPFPGMDPYLEERWSDVHATLIALIKEALQSRLPAALRARSEERVVLEEVGGPEQSYRSDIAVVNVGRQSTIAPPGGAAATLEPVIIDFYEGPAVERWVHIIDRTNGNRVVTAIEVLSPWNKAPGKLNQSYRKKLDDYKRASVSTVEIDLLRYPDRSHMEVKLDDLPADQRTPYLVCIRRAWQATRWFVYPTWLQQPLPTIPIPLREQDSEASLDLQPLIDRVYIAGGHDDIDYSKPCDQPLSRADAEWARSVVQEAKR